MTPRQRFALAGRKGNIVVATRAALRAQRLVMLLEQGLSREQARARLGIPERTAKRYVMLWGRRA